MKNLNSNTTLVKVKLCSRIALFTFCSHSNTTLVKVKFSKHLYFQRQIVNSNTTLVKVKLPLRDGDTDRFDEFKYNTC